MRREGKTGIIQSLHFVQKVNFTRAKPNRHHCRCELNTGRIEIAGSFRNLAEENTSPTAASVGSRTLYRAMQFYRQHLSTPSSPHPPENALSPPTKSKRLLRLHLQLMLTAESL